MTAVKPSCRPTHLAPTAVAVVVGALLSLSSCGAGASTSRAPATVAPVAASSGESKVTSLQSPATSSSIQLCLDLGPEATMINGAAAAATIAALADAIADLPEVNQAGLTVEVFSTATAAEGGGLLFEFVVPDYRDVTVGTGLAPTERRAQLVDQAEQRERKRAAEEAAKELSVALASVTPEPTHGTDVLSCVSRANSQLGGRPPARRLLVVASPLALPERVSEVYGSLGDSYQLLVLMWGPDSGVRRTAWESTWSSLGATTNLTVLQLDDGLGSPLGNAVTAVAGPGVSP